MEEQKTRARASWKGAAKQTANPAYQKLPKSAFEGYRQTRSNGCEVLAIIHNGQGAQELKAGEEGEVILDHTPFYAESGGRLAIAGGFTATITTPSLRRSRAATTRSRGCGRIRSS
jgi:alanyl-tRNA synthetase